MFLLGKFLVYFCYFVLCVHCDNKALSIHFCVHGVAAIRFCSCPRLLDVRERTPYFTLYICFFNELRAVIKKSI